MDPLPKVKQNINLTSFDLKSPWDKNELDPLYLLTLEEYDSLPDGTVLTSIYGKMKVKTPDSQDRNNKNYIDLETRAGFIAYGLRESQIKNNINVF